MPRIETHRPSDLPDYIRVVLELQKGAGHALWFRGIRRASFGLLPSLYRHPSITRPEELLRLEQQLMTRFRQRSIPYHSRGLDDDWDVLFLMQHYGVPTRLLDWTENPLIALYFAFLSYVAPITGGSTTTDDSAVVWVLDPYNWNQAALRHVSYSGGALSTLDDDLRGHAPKSTTMSAHPVALYGAHNSPRIVAQQGVFTIFGSERSPMDSLIQNGSFPASSLQRIVISPTRMKNMRRALFSQGITETVVFPDLEGLAREIKRTFQFEA